MRNPPSQGRLSAYNILLPIIIPGKIMDEAETHPLYQTPETSGYSPSLGKKLSEAKQVRRSYKVELTPQEADEFEEWCSDLSTGADDTLRRAVYTVIDRIEKARNVAAYQIQTGHA